MKLSKNEIIYRIIKKLVRHRIWGGKHTSIENIPKGMPPELRKDIEAEVKELIRENIILSHPTSYGLQVSLNPRMAEEIKRILEGQF